MSELGCVEGPEWTESANTEKSMRRSRKKGTVAGGDLWSGEDSLFKYERGCSMFARDVVDLVEWERSTWEGKGMKVKAKSLTG